VAGITERSLSPEPVGSEPVGSDDDSTDPPSYEDDGDLIRLATLPAGPARDELRERVICAWLPAAHRAAGRYRHAGEPLEDLIQVATVGLIQAVDRFDASRGIPFRNFAMPTIMGELKRHFRDKGWSVSVSRRVQELHQEIHRAEPELAQRLRRMPTVADLAAHLNISEADVMAGRDVGPAYNARSLNRRAHDEGYSAEVGDLIGHEDRELNLVADRESLRAAIAALPARLRVLVTLRFVENLTQSQIAEQIGISQMHVSRLIGRALAILRAHMLAEVDERPEGTGDASGSQIGHHGTTRVHVGLLTAATVRRLPGDRQGAALDLPGPGWSKGA
jgi:RNA polymerase sigma-B factor